MAELLAVHKVFAGYNSAEVLRDISFSLNEGETLGLLGRNGTGKTTLINTIVGLTNLYRGEIVLKSRALQRLDVYKRALAGLGWVPQERGIFKSLTVHENLTATARPGYWTPSKIYEMFPRLAERRHNMGTTLSGGEQQMLAIGRALALNPVLLLLDEPTEGLAPIIVDELLAAIRTITTDSGLSAIIVEQHPHLVLPICNRALILDQGMIVCSSDAESLLQNEQLLAEHIGVGHASERRKSATSRSPASVSENR